MEPKPFSMIPAIASRVYLGICNYHTPTIDLETAAGHTTQLETFLPLQYSFDGTVRQNGIGMTGSTDLTIGIDTSRRTITPIGGGFILQMQNQWPILYYKGVAVPSTHFDGDPSSSTGKVFLTIASTASIYTSTDPNDYLMYCMDFLPAIITNVDIPNISMPVSSSGYGGVGVDEQVYTTMVRDDVEVVGSVKFQMSQTAWGSTGGDLRNQAGAEVLKRIYKTDFDQDTAWDNRQQIINANSEMGQSIAIVFLEHSGLKYDSAIGKVWGSVTTVPSLLVTDVSAPENVSNDATDPILMQIDFTVKFPELVSRNTILTTGP